MTKHRWLFITALALGALVVTAGAVVARGPGSPGSAPVAQSALGTGFTYQGRLDEGGNPANGSFDMRFVLFDADVGGTQVGGIVALEDVAVANGLFTARLDFGDGAFRGDARWLDIAVRPGSETGAFSPLVPRQEVTPTPYAMHAFSSDEADHATTADSAASAPWSGLTGVPAGFADDTDDDSLASLACAVGQAAVWNGSSWACLSLFSFALSSLDSDGAGRVNKVAIGVDGFGLISQGWLKIGGGSKFKVAHCANLACTSATITTLEGAFPSYMSMTIGGDGFGLISYTNGGPLKVAHCANLACSAATISTLEVASNAQFTSVAIGADGLGLISYTSSGDLMAAHCNDLACTSATVSSLDSAIGAFDTSLAVGADGLGLISYSAASGDLKVAHCDNVACTSATLSTLDGNSAQTSVAIGQDGFGLISYQDTANIDLKVAHCDNAACTSATLSTLDSVGNVGTGNSVAIGVDGLGVISYATANFSAFFAAEVLKFAHCDNAACTSATVSTLGGGQSPTSIVIGADGLGLISYRDAVGVQLSAAHCSDVVTCIP